MKSVIIYSQDAPSEKHQELVMDDNGNKRSIYLRTEVFNGPPEVALDFADPTDDETILNAMSLQDESDDGDGWLDEIVDTLRHTEGVSNFNWECDEDGVAVFKMNYGDEELSFEAATDGDYIGIYMEDGTVQDMTEVESVQSWIAGELLSRLLAAKEKIVELEREKQWNQNPNK